jgi:hypothetical protein
MKTKLSVLLLSLVVCLCAFTTLSLGEEQEIATLVFTMVHTVKPSMVVQYEETAKEIMEQFKKQNYPYTLYGWEEGNFKYYYFHPVKNYADVENLWKAWGNLVEKWGNEGSQIVDRLNSSIESFEDYLLRSLPELSYIPEDPRLKDEEEVFAIWDIAYIHPEKQTEYLQLMEKGLALFKKIKFKDRIYFFTGEMGMEKPVYIGCGFGKDPEDYWSQNKKMWEAMGEDSTAILLEFIKVLRKREFKQFWYRQDLSYVAEGK